MSSVCLPTLPPLRAGRFGASGFFLEPPKTCRNPTCQTCKTCRNPLGFPGPLWGFSGASWGALGASGGLDECRMYVTSGTGQEGEVLFGRCSRIIRSVFACYFCRFVWFCDPRANAISLLAERRIRGRLLGLLRLELPLSGSTCAIPAQRKNGLDFSEGVTCFRLLRLSFDVRSRLGPSFSG